MRGLLGAAGIDGPAAAVAHLAAVWPTALGVRPALGVAPQPWKGATELAVDASHHAVYVTVTSAAYATLER